MSICASGASEPIPGLQDDLILTSAVIAAAISETMPWLEPFIGAAFGILTLHLPTFCAADPPADPGLTGADLLQLIAFGPDPSNTGASGKLTQLVERFLWYQVCQCTTGSTPSAPAAPVAPVDIPSINPTTVFTGPTASTCAEWHNSFSAWPSGSNNENFIPSLSAFSGSVTAGPLPSNKSYVTVTTVAGTPSLSGSSYIHILQFWLPGTDYSTPISGVQWTVNPNSTFTKVIAIPATAAQVSLAVGKAISGGAAVTCPVDVDVVVTCSGAPGQAIAPCCPPDVSTLGLLNQILGMVTLIQRQAAPFGYIASTAHAALTGDGEIAVADLLGFSAAITAHLTGALGEVVGDPSLVFNAGWLNWGTADGWLRRVDLDAMQVISIPPGAGAYTRIGYSLSPGTVVTVTELKAEP